jgi:hypothetical protein
LYSEFTVFMRHRYANVEGLGPHNGVVRSFTLATRARPGFHRVVSQWGDRYAVWPADFFKRHVTVLSSATPAEFRSIVAPVVAHLTQHENAAGCMGR